MCVLRLSSDVLCARLITATYLAKLQTKCQSRSSLGFRHLFALRCRRRRRVIVFAKPLKHRQSTKIVSNDSRCKKHFKA